MDNVDPRPHRRTGSWIAKYASRPGSSSGSSSGFPGSNNSKESGNLPAPIEGQELLVSSPSGVQNINIPPNRPDSSESSPSSISKRWSRSFLLTSSPKHSPPLQQLEPSPNVLEPATSAQPVMSLRPPEMSSRTSGSFGKMSFSSMMGGLSALSLSRSSTNNTVGDEKESKEYRGRSMSLSKQSRSSSALNVPDPDNSPSRSRARSQSPFSFRRFRTRERDPSPTPQALPLTHSDAELSDSATSILPRTAFADDPDSGDDTVGETDAETDDEGWSEDDDLFDTVTERNTERNALLTTIEGGSTGPEADVDVDPDPLGEGVNVVVPPEPYFPSTLNSYASSGVGSSGSVRGKRNPRRRKSTRHEPLSSQTSRPIFQRDRCTIVITQGDPEAMRGDRKIKRYIVASDLSEESRYALEWGIGTVLRDGDEMLIVSVVENESRVDPATPNRAVKLRSQQERQGLAYILTRQATSLLQRTKLNVKVSCQAWHAKNSRHMLLDIVDYNEPTMLIVGSRGVGQVKGILLGSTSNYLIHKCSVPVMVARRRLKRPPKRSAHLAKHRVHVSLAEAGIDRVAPRVDQDVQVMRDEIARHERRDENRVGSGRDGRGIDEEADAEETEAGEGEGEGEDYEGDDSQDGVKVAG